MSAEEHSSIVRLVDDVMADVTSNGVTRRALRRLTVTFGAALLSRASQIVDDARVTRLVIEDECILVEVISTSSIYYVIMPGVHYCACRTFAQALDAAVYPMCHHLLAVRLADALDAMESREVRWETVNALLTDMYCVGRAASNTNVIETKTPDVKNAIIRVVIDG